MIALQASLRTSRFVRGFVFLVLVEGLAMRGAPSDKGARPLGGSRANEYWVRLARAA